jgi:hypothetical protein
MDNAKLHTIPETGKCYQFYRFCHILQSPYNPDISPHGFFLFGYIKNQLRGNELEETDELKEAIKEFLNQIPIDMFKCVSRTWSRD